MIKRSLEENIKMSDVTTVEEMDRPQVSHEDYLELVSMRQSVLELKAQKSDVLEFVNVAQQYVQRMQQAQEQLNALNEAVNENANALQERMKEMIEPLGITGEFTIADTEPHYILPSE